MPPRLIGSLLSGTTTAASVRNGSCASVPKCEAFATGIWKLYIPTCYCLQHGSGAGRKLSRIQRKVTKSKSNACGFGAVITRILTHVGVGCENHR
ncbi:hypothetical protein Bca52824_064965 [Brassica carinata]|uniref:Uncharacterized protein n=1 Tax=Brassica carinata TaxID=52824 RepID=A0A8X7QHI9_BRACI|nr:hypothetical protein Bca52824_064965 [Brassica carinata]